MGKEQSKTYFCSREIGKAWYICAKRVRKIFRILGIPMIFKNTRSRVRAEKFLALFAVVIVSLLFVYWQVNAIHDKLRDSILETQVVAINDLQKMLKSCFCKILMRRVSKRYLIGRMS